MNSSFFFFFSSLNRFGILGFFPSSSQFQFCDRIRDLLLPATNPMLELQKRGFNDDDSALNLWESTKLHGIRLNFGSGNLGFVCLFLSFSEFVMILILTAKREKMESVCVMWLWFYHSAEFWHCVLFIACHVCTWSNGDVTRGIEHLRGTCELILTQRTFL